MKNVIKTIAVLSLLGLSNISFSATATTDTKSVVGGGAGAGTFAPEPASDAIDNSRDKNMAVLTGNARVGSDSENAATQPNAVTKELGFVDHALKTPGHLPEQAASNQK